MAGERKSQLVPYDMVLPGFEAVYTGERAAIPPESTGGPATSTVDDAGNVITRWSTWTWTFPGEEKGWADEIRTINGMQERLGLLDDETRQIRAHIGSLVPCDSGFSVTVDELLSAIGKGKLCEPTFHNGCWMAGMWWDDRTTQPGQDESMQTVEAVLRGYLAGTSQERLQRRIPHAEGFIRRAYRWLGPVAELSNAQMLMLERMLLPFEFFTERDSDYQAVNKTCFEEGGRGLQLDSEISALAGLPSICPNYRQQYRDTVVTISDPSKRELYTICCQIAHGLHGLSDCHHGAFRWIESWIHGIGTGRSIIPTRKRRVERERIGRLLFAYLLGLDKWLMGKPMQFVLLDLGHVDLGFDPKNEILRVYAYLGEGKTPVKEWLAACLWYNLAYSKIGGLFTRDQHSDLRERARSAGVSGREWMDAVAKRE